MHLESRIKSHFCSNSLGGRVVSDSASSHNWNWKNVGSWLPDSDQVVQSAPSHVGMRLSNKRVGRRRLSAQAGGGKSQYVVRLIAVISTALNMSQKSSAVLPNPLIKLRDLGGKKSN